MHRAWNKSRVVFDTESRGTAEAVKYGDLCAKADITNLDGRGLASRAGRNKYTGVTAVMQLAPLFLVDVVKSS